MVQPKPLRSMLWVPGNREEWMQNAPQYGADALVLDLEDSVPLPEKVYARQLVRKILDTQGTAGYTTLVRVNDLESGLIEDDVEALVCSGLYGIVLPKVRSSEDIVQADILLKTLERRAGLEVGTILIKASIETARAIREAYEIVKASPRVCHTGIGHIKSGDTARALGYVWTREGKETFFVRSKVLLDARAAGDPYPCAGAWSDIRDLEGLRAYCLEMRQLGYTGIALLHPSHIPIANEIFTPSSDEIAYWRGVVQTMEEAEKAGRAAISYQGQMIDIAMVKMARDMLEMAQKLGVLKK